MAKIKITNKLRQGLNILLKGGDGKLHSWIIPSKGVRIVEDLEMSQDILDKEVRGYVYTEPVKG
jgi:hypothetical protein